MYYDDQKNSVPAAAGAMATSHTVFLLNRVQTFPHTLHCLPERFRPTVCDHMLLLRSVEMLPAPDVPSVSSSSSSSSSTSMS